jgi:hypothetical protein
MLLFLAPGRPPTSAYSGYFRDPSKSCKRELKYRDKTLSTSSEVMPRASHTAWKLSVVRTPSEKVVGDLSTAARYFLQSVSSNLHIRVCRSFTCRSQVSTDTVDQRRFFQCRHTSGSFLLVEVKRHPRILRFSFLCRRYRAL